MDKSGPVEIWAVVNTYESGIAQRRDRTGRFYDAQDTVMHMKYPGNTTQLSFRCFIQ